MATVGRAARAKAIRNEQVKLTATFLNGAGIAIFAIGGIAPLVGFASGSSAASGLAVAVTSLVAIGVGVLVHFIARFVLKGIRA